MPWTRVVLAVALMATFAAAAPATPAVAVPPIVKKINKARAQHGVPALRYSPSLAGSSEQFARFLMASDRFGHASRIWASRGFSRLGECLAKTSGWRAKRSRVVRMWLHSSTHRSILLSRRFTRVGVAPARGRFWGRRSTIWVAQFGRP